MDAGFAIVHGSRLTGRDDLYRNWLRVCGHVQNFDYEDLFSDDDEQASGDRARRLHHRRRPRLHLVTGPELTSDDDLDRAFLALMGDSS